MSLIFKKGDKEDIGNYRPISTLSVMYKIFSKVILARLRKTLDSEQPPEQTGFRPGFSTMDNLQTVTRVIEACREHKIDLLLTFIDYKKAFDSVEVVPMLQALENQGVHHQYLTILEECLSGTSTTIRLYDRQLITRSTEAPARVTLYRLQSSAQFSNTLSGTSTGRNTTLTPTHSDSYEESELMTDNYTIYALRFADDIVIFSKSLAEASSSLNELDAVGREVCLEINLNKTQYMSNFVSTNAG